MQSRYILHCVLHMVFHAHSAKKEHSNKVLHAHPRTFDGNGSRSVIYSSNGETMETHAPFECTYYTTDSSLILTKNNQDGSTSITVVGPCQGMGYHLPITLPDWSMQRYATMRYHLPFTLHNWSMTRHGLWGKVDGELNLYNFFFNNLFIYFSWNLQHSPKLYRRQYWRTNATLATVILATKLMLG